MAETGINARLEAFCDGVFAIALTLLIIEIKIPATTHVETTGELWRAIAHLAPSIFAFVLSFAVILVTWVNHHAMLRLVDKSSPSFIYANGLMLLTVVFIPFPTALLGEYLLTDHAAPAVVLYSAVCAVQAIAWSLLTSTALGPRRLTRSERAAMVTREKRAYSYFAFALYTLCAVVALWFPQAVAVVVSVTWLVWLIVSITLAGE